MKLLFHDQIASLNRAYAFVKLVEEATEAVSTTEWQKDVIHSCGDAREAIHKAIRGFVEARNRMVDR